MELREDGRYEGLLHIDLEEEILKLDKDASNIVDQMVEVMCESEPLFEMRLTNAEDEELLKDEYIPIYTPITTFKNVKIAKNLFHKKGIPLINEALKNLLKQVKE